MFLVFLLTFCSFFHPFLLKTHYKPVGRATSLSGQKRYQYSPLGSPDAGELPVSLWGYDWEQGRLNSPFLSKS